jgi:hypothetical protein
MSASPFHLPAQTVSGIYHLLNADGGVALRRADVEHLLSPRQRVLVKARVLEICRRRWGR